MTMDSVETFYRGARVLVTGGMGFIGSNLAKRLVECGADVLVVDSLQPRSGANRSNLSDIEQRIRLEILDLRCGEKLADLVTGQDIIFNLAGLVSHIDSMTDPETDLGANAHAQLVLLEACRRHAPKAALVFASTRQVYGRPCSFPVAEDHPLRPVDINGIHKLAAEAYHTLYYQVYGLRTVSLRLTNTFGPRMRVKDARQTFLGVWFRRVVEDAAFEVWGGRQKRDLCYVDDAVDAFLAAAASPRAEGRIFNIGGCPPVTLGELAESLVTLAGRGRFEVKEFPAEFLRIDIGDYFADDMLFRSLTGWAPRVSLQDGLARTVAFYKERLSEYV